MDTLTIAGAVLALVGALKELFPSLQGNFTRLLALIIGALLGYYGIEGSNIISGGLAGLMAVGATTVVDRATNR